MGVRGVVGVWLMIDCRLSAGGRKMERKISGWIYDDLMRLGYIDE